MIKAIVFDFDGVIIESADIKTKAFRMLFERDFPDNVHEIVEYHLDNMGISRYVKFKYIYENILKLKITPDLEKELGENFSRIVLDQILNAPFVPGALEFLKNNYTRYPLLVASGTPENELLHIATQRKVYNFFKEIHGTPPGKVEIIGGILAKYRWSPQEVVFVGDAETDLNAAVKTGLKFVARIAPGCNQLVNCKYQMDNLFKLQSLLSLLEVE